MHTVSSGARVRDIATDDLPAVAEFLTAQLNHRISPRGWVERLAQPWAGPDPVRGFLLEVDDAIVGVQLLFVSTRQLDGRTVTVCNLGALCIAAPHRSQALRLVRAALAMRDCVFTDLSPSGASSPSTRRLGFVHLDTTTALVPALRLPRPAPWEVRGRRRPPTAVEASPRSRGAAPDLCRPPGLPRRRHVLRQRWSRLLRRLPPRPPQGSAAVRLRAARQRPGGLSAMAPLAVPPPAAARRTASLAELRRGGSRPGGRGSCPVATQDVQDPMPSRPLNPWTTSTASSPCGLVNPDVSNTSRAPGCTTW